MRNSAVEGVRPGRADRTARRVLGSEHEVIDEELRTPIEEIRQRLRSVVGLEAILLVDRHPRQLSPLARQLVIAAGQLLLASQQLLAGDKPLLARSYLVLRHRVCLLCR